MENFSEKFNDHSELTPFSVHPKLRELWFSRGQELFNDEQYFEAHEAWEHLWRVENHCEKTRVQGLILLCGFYVHVQKKNYSAALTMGKKTLEKLSARTKNQFYENFDLEPLLNGLLYNLNLIQAEVSGLEEASFLFPKLFSK